MNGSFSDLHAAWLPSHEEINVVNCAVLTFHIDTGEILAASETREPIVMDLDQIQRKIFTPIVDVKLFVAGLLARARDVPLDPGRDIGLADLPRRGALRGCCCYLW